MEQTKGRQGENKTQIDTSINYSGVTGAAAATLLGCEREALELAHPGLVCVEGAGRVRAAATLSPKAASSFAVFLGSFSERPVSRQTSDMRTDLQGVL